LGDQIGGKITFKGNNNSLKVQKNYFCNGAPYGSGIFGSEIHLNAYKYIKTLPRIKIPSDQLDEIKRMFEIRIKELEKMDNPLFQGLIGVDTIILDKITAE